MPKKRLTESQVYVDRTDFDKQMSSFAKQASKAMIFAMMASFREVGLRSVQDYMTRAHVISGSSGYNVGTAGSSKLNIRSGRLMRSLVAAFDFSGGSGGTDESIREIKVSGNKVSGIYGTRVPYAAIHEYGGIISARNAPFLVFRVGPFWMKKRSVEIPKRPFLHPALEASETRIEMIFKETFEQVAFNVSD